MTITSIYKKLLDCKNEIKWEYILNTICTIVCISFAFLLLYIISFINYLGWLGNLMLTLCAVALWITREKFLPYLIGVPICFYRWARALFTRDIEHKYWRLIMLITQSCYNHSLHKNYLSIEVCTYNKSDSTFDRRGVPFMEWIIFWNQYDSESKTVTVSCRYLEGCFVVPFSKEFPDRADQEFIYNSMLRGLDAAKIEYLEEELCNNKETVL